MVTAGGDFRAKDEGRSAPPKKRAEKATAEFVRSAYKKIYTRPEWQTNFRYRPYARGQHNRDVARTIGPPTRQPRHQPIGAVHLDR